MGSGAGGCSGKSRARIGKRKFEKGARSRIPIPTDFKQSTQTQAHFCDAKEGFDGESQSLTLAHRLRKDREDAIQVSRLRPHCEGLTFHVAAFFRDTEVCLRLRALLE